MHNDRELKEISAKIKVMQKMAGELSDRSEDFPALQRNLVRIAASLTMLELNISDVVDL